MTPFFFYLTTLILTNRIDVQHVDVNVYRVTKTYFGSIPYFELRPKCPAIQNNLVFFTLICASILVIISIMHEF